ncbi:IMPACT family protein [Jiulongibacter sediminis]|uniref:Thymidylate synthase n=1 Tax=Jiulongibacter sediminis TaxID=1605367 RepID=A0A0P7BZN7_9BACT|nr:YigZ family protein [Jiulongibacter sediminis]KPM47125.1 thymidylate synthase [Jiulongibacter sediminis]TBX22686.1 thymidylate synthase [Jiulongibacter sediminis]
MSVSDTYFTISAPSEGLFKDKGSKFFGYAFPVTDEEEVKLYSEEIKKQHPKARHHCYAYRLGTDDLNFRANDDGEPSGSAGKPILNVLLSKNLRNVFVVVVRYFGGTLLGVPGLINAYKTATEEALAEAKLEEKTINETLQLSFDIAHMNDVMRIIKKHELNIISQDYTTQYILTIEVRLSLLEEVIREVEELRFVEVR